MIGLSVKAAIFGTAGGALSALTFLYAPSYEDINEQRGLCKEVVDRSSSERAVLTDAFNYTSHKI